MVKLPTMSTLCDIFMHYDSYLKIWFQSYWFCTVCFAPDSQIPKITICVRLTSCLQHAPNDTDPTLSDGRWCCIHCTQCTLSGNWHVWQQPSVFISREKKNNLSLSCSVWVGHKWRARVECYWNAIRLKCVTMQSLCILMSLRLL